MRKGSRWVGLVVSLALVVVITVGTISAQGAYYRVGKYAFYYNNATELAWAKGLAAYVPEAWRAAYTVLGKNSLNGQIQVRFYSQRDSRLGYWSSGTQNIYLNRYYSATYAQRGAVLAYNTSFVLFYNYTLARNWFCAMTTYSAFISRALASYTSEVVYAYHTKYTAATVKTNLKRYSKLAYGSAFPTTNYMSWYGFVYYQMTGNVYQKATASWGLNAVGYFLTGRLTRSTNSKVANLLYYLRSYSKYLSSSTSHIRNHYWDSAYYRAYGYHIMAPGDSMLANSSKDKKYLFGQFYWQWYI